MNSQPQLVEQSSLNYPNDSGTLNRLRYAATQCKVTPPPGATIWFIRTFGEGCVSLGGRVAMAEIRPC